MPLLVSELSCLPVPAFIVLFISVVPGIIPLFLNLVVVVVVLVVSSSCCHYACFPHSGCGVASCISPLALFFAGP
jgi:hypothetical protein